MNLVRRILLYIIALIPSLGLFLNRLISSEFNIDEFQHTHLAWMAVHADKLQYRDLWDNHGPIYTIYNAILIKVFNLQADISTYMIERYFALLVWVLALIVLFELFRNITDKWYFAVLGPWIFATSIISLHAIEVRPDGFQCLFLYLGLLMLVKAFKTKKTKFAFFSGIFFTLMLMSNLKSLSALAAIIISLLLLNFFFKERKALKYLKFLSLGLGLGLTIFAILLAATGLLKGYILDNVLFNFAYIFIPNDYAVKKTIRLYSTEDHLLMSLIPLTFVFWFYSSFKSNDNKIDPVKFIIFVTVALLTLSRLVANLWSQYDLLFIPLLCFLMSVFIIQLFESQVFSKIESKLKKRAVLFLSYICLLILGWHQYLYNPEPLRKYHREANNAIETARKLIAKDEHIENFALDTVELGFFETASPWIVLHNKLMNTYELLLNKSIYGKEYIDLLNKKKVRILYGEKRVLEQFESQEVKDFIIQNYRPQKRYWVRKGVF